MQKMGCRSQTRARCGCCRRRWGRAETWRSPSSACPNVRFLREPPTACFSKNTSKVWLIDSCRGSAMPARVEKLCLLESGWCPKEGASPQPDNAQVKDTESTDAMQVRRNGRAGEGLACIAWLISIVLLAISSLFGSVCVTSLLIWRASFFHGGV
jgi:hypothetical protein